MTFLDHKNHCLWLLSLLLGNSIYAVCMESNLLDRKPSWKKHVL